MAPNIVGNAFIIAETVLNSDDAANNNNKLSSSVCHNSTLNNKGCSAVNRQVVGHNYTTETPKKEYRTEIVWRNVVIFTILHYMAFYGLYLAFVEKTWTSPFYTYFVGTLGGMGITAGAHRLWSHRSYKAKWPMRLILMICQTIALQNSIHEWVRDHRVHHKFTDTNADPHNSKRGFFFSHMGWLMCKKHPDVKEKGKQVDMSDLEADPIVMFQKKYYVPLAILFGIVLPVAIAYYVLGLSFNLSFYQCGVLRYTFALHFTWLVNSAAHFYGMKPYDKYISPTDNWFVVLVAHGEGWHNYHHIFPWDYKAAELGASLLNMTTVVINLFAKLGMAYDLKTVSNEMIRKRVNRTGDGSHPAHGSDDNNNVTNDILRLNHEAEETLVWGWEDKDMQDDDRKNVCILKNEKE